jgi:hypothetical protein
MKMSDNNSITIKDDPPSYDEVIKSDSNKIDYDQIDSNQIDSNQIDSKTEPNELTFTKRYRTSNDIDLESVAGVNVNVNVSTSYTPVSLKTVCKCGADYNYNRCSSQSYLKSQIPCDYSDLELCPNMTKTSYNCYRSSYDLKTRKSNNKYYY